MTLPFRRELTCDLATQPSNQWIDRLLEAASNPPKEQLLHLLQTGQFDLVLTFAAGGFDVIHPKPAAPASAVRTFADFAASINAHQPEHGHDRAASECPSTAQRLLDAQKQQRAIDQLFAEQRVPVFALRSACCQWSTDAELSTLWRHTIHKLLNFVWLLETGVQGRVLSGGAPVRAATVLVDGRAVRVSSNRAHFKVVLAAGAHELIVRASGFADERRVVSVTKGVLLDLGDVQLVAGQSGRVQPAVIEAETPAAAAAAAAAMPATSGGRSISGFVVDATNHPIVGARVRVSDAAGKLWENVTQTNGAFVLAGMPFGNLTMHVEADGHVNSER